MWALGIDNDEATATKDERQTEARDALSDASQASGMFFFNDTCGYLQLGYV